MRHLNAHNLTALRAEKIIFRHLNLELNAGELLYIRGNNGSGKTTLLQTLAGLLHPQGGHIDRHVPHLYLGHQAGTHPLLSVRENLQLFAKLYHPRTSKPPLPQILDHALQQVGLHPYQHQQTRHLSAGQKRRCQLARLWLPAPKPAPIWLLDEPFTALDQPTIARLIQHCEHHLHQGGSIALTSHQPFTLNHPIQYLDLTPHA